MSPLFADLESPLTSPAPLAALCLPNLQGEQRFLGLENCRLVWVPIEDSLDSQVERLRREYDGHPLLIGSSFGALAAWKFASEQRPVALKGLVLIDALPDLESFPRWRLLGMRLMPRLPSRWGQAIYDLYAKRREHAARVDLRRLLLRLHSIQAAFPNPDFPCPTLVLVSKDSVYQSWLDLAETRPLLRVEKATGLSATLNDWVQAKCLSPE